MYQVGCKLVLDLLHSMLLFTHHVTCTAHVVCLLVCWDFEPCASMLVTSNYVRLTEVDCARLADLVGLQITLSGGGGGMKLNTTEALMGSNFQLGSHAGVVPECLR
jgi:hypothetical protein